MPTLCDIITEVMILVVVAILAYILGAASKEMNYVEPNPCYTWDRGNHTILIKADQLKELTRTMKVIEPTDFNLYCEEHTHYVH